MAVEVWVAGGDWVEMLSHARRIRIWQTPIPIRGENTHIGASTKRGRADEDNMEPNTPDKTPPWRFGDRRDRGRVGAWSKMAILGTEFGPNRSGRRR